MKEYISIATEYSTEYIVEKSKFIGTVAPCQSLEEAQAFITKISKQYWDATHNCTALCIGANFEMQRSSDNGEPSGTAGKPILNALLKKNITNAVIVVTRYFGGIKLGAGGLIRAYSHIANQVLTEASKICVTPRIIIETKIPYAFFNAVEIYLNQNNIYTEKDFGSEVYLTMYLPPNSSQNIMTELVNLTNDNISFKELESKFVTLPFTGNL